MNVEYRRVVFYLFNDIKIRSCFSELESQLPILFIVLYTLFGIGLIVALLYIQFVASNVKPV